MGFNSVFKALIATTVNELEMYALQGYNAASTDNCLMIFWDNLMAPSLRGKNSKRKLALQIQS
jgi:hypothetical protein